MASRRSRERTMSSRHSARKRCDSARRSSDCSRDHSSGRMGRSVGVMTWTFPSCGLFKREPAGNRPAAGTTRPARTRRQVRVRCASTLRSLTAKRVTIEHATGSLGRSPTCSGTRRRVATPHGRRRQTSRRSHRHAADPATRVARFLSRLSPDVPPQTVQRAVLGRRMSSGR